MRLGSSTRVVRQPSGMGGKLIFCGGCSSCGILISTYHMYSADGASERSPMFRITRLVAGQMLPCLLLMAWGWGFGQLPAFFSSRARVGLLILAVIGAIAAAILHLELHPLRRGNASLAKQRVELAVLWVLSLALLWFLPFADRRGVLTLSSDAWRYAGLLFCSVGVAVRLFAMKALGAQFSAYVTLQSNHRLIREGIYRYVRHPLYLSLLLIPAGIALVFSSSLALPIFIVSVVFVVDRIRREDHLLAAHFGREFEDYRRQTPNLLPIIF